MNDFLDMFLPIGNGFLILILVLSVMVVISGRGDDQ